MSIKTLICSIAVLFVASLPMAANAFFFIIPIPNLAKPATLNSIIEALEKSEETKAVAYASEDKLFGSKNWVWAHFSGHVTQAEADRNALRGCEISLAAAKAQQAGGKELYDFGKKVCELYAFANKTVSNRAPETQPATYNTVSPAYNAKACTLNFDSDATSSLCSRYWNDAVDSCNGAILRVLGSRNVQTYPKSACGTPTAAASLAPPASPQPEQPTTAQTPTAISASAAPEPPQAQPVLSDPAAGTALMPQTQSPPAKVPPNDSGTGRKLRELNDLRKEGLITEREYNEKRKAILSTM